MEQPIEFQRKGDPLQYKVPKIAADPSSYPEEIKRLYVDPAVAKLYAAQSIPGDTSEDSNRSVGEPQNDREASESSSQKPKEKSGLDGCPSQHPIRGDQAFSPKGEKPTGIQGSPDTPSSPRILVSPFKPPIPPQRDGN